MHISNIPIELFKEILEYIPLRNASEIMLVNKEWYREYRAIIYNQRDAKFKELLYSQWWDWKIPCRLIDCFDYEKFLIVKLHRFCNSFDMIIEFKIREIREFLESEMKTIDKERKVIDKLMDTHELSDGGFEGWFPNWLWEKHKNNRYKDQINTRDRIRVCEIIRKIHRMARQAWYE